MDKNEEQDSRGTSGGDQPGTWLLVLGMLLPMVATYVYFYTLSDEGAGVQQAGMTICKIVQFSLPVVWVITYCRGQVGWKSFSMNGMWIGIGFGLMAVIAAMALYEGWLIDVPAFQQAAAEVVNRVEGMGIRSPAPYIALSAFYVLGHSLLEEYYWRWFIFGMLRTRTHLSTAIVVSSLGFSLHHIVVLAKFFGLFSVGTWFFSLCVAVGGVFWAWLYQRTGRLYAPWVSHALVDAAIFAIGFRMLFPIP